jgi:hypothetical protein
MGIHDVYGKAVMRAGAGKAFIDLGPTVCVDYGAGGARIDGVVAGRIAVEIESRTPKQVRGAILDLLCHSFTKKLLVLIPAHMPAVRTETQCRTIFTRFGVSREEFRIAVLRGTGDTPAIGDDAALLRRALVELGFVAEVPPATP